MALRGVRLRKNFIPRPACGKIWKADSRAHVSDFRNSPPQRDGSRVKEIYAPDYLPKYVCVPVHLALPNLTVLDPVFPVLDVTLTTFRRNGTYPESKSIRPHGVS